MTIEIRSQLHIHTYKRICAKKFLQRKMIIRSSFTVETKSIAGPKSISEDLTGD